MLQCCRLISRVKHVISTCKDVLIVSWLSLMLQKYEVNCTIAWSSPLLWFLFRPVWKEFKSYRQSLWQKCSARAERYSHLNGEEIFGLRWKDIDLKKSEYFFALLKGNVFVPALVSITKAKLFLMLKEESLKRD